MGVVIVLTNFPEFSVAGKLCQFDGEENVQALDYSVLHHAAERFISAMVLSGVFERHRQLRGAAVELGATEVPSFLKNSRQHRACVQPGSARACGNVT